MLAYDIEAEIAAAKVRLGYRADEPVDGPTVCAELPDHMHGAFWERQINWWAQINDVDPNAEV
ncbi:hypothetical protein KIH74_23030 [Kineosporia sp. J2-2]|uniref:Uncharacterized protein n=1 Tax=Kineosporia corallincola TaxID=2835133 RepID=A0ABS5TQE8_9ACTN|nr:hypothetical protein [Kineosporia corallincola]MBT0771834.1 hypothetical protein [Kineosporia corallincola]